LWRRPPALALAMTSRLLTKPACVGRHLGAIAQTIKGFFAVGARCGSVYPANYIML
jgi:hypothetical protein